MSGGDWDDGWRLKIPPAYTPGGTDVALADGGTGASLADPGADRVMAWDDSAGSVAFIALADITTEAAPAAGDYMLLYRAEGDLVKVDWDDLPGAGGGISNVVEDLTPQLGGNLDPNTFGVTGNWNPSANDGAALGTTSLKWSDLHLANGSTINFDGGDFTITHSGNFLAYYGGSVGFYRDNDATTAVTFHVNLHDSAAVNVAVFEGDRATPAANDEAYIQMKLSDSAGNQDEFARLTWKATDVTSTSEDGQLELDVIVAGALTNVWTLNNAEMSIGTSRAATVGTVELGHATDTTLSRSAAGVLAVEGVPILKATSGVGTTPTSSTTTTIAHGLGRTPTIIRISGKSGFTSNAAATPTTSSEGLYCSTGNSCIYQGINGTTTIAAATSTAFAIFLDTSVGNNISGVIGNVGGTNFDIVWTETGTHTRGVYMWEAQ